MLQIMKIFKSYKYKLCLGLLYYLQKSKTLKILVNRKLKGCYMVMRIYGSDGSVDSVKYYIIICNTNLANDAWHYKHFESQRRLTGHRWEADGSQYNSWEFGGKYRIGEN